MRFAIILVVLLCMAGLSGFVSAAPADPQKNITIGALLPLTGELETHGIAAKAAVEIAESDINEFLAKTGQNIRIKVVIEDTKSDPATALQKLQKLESKGIFLFVGPEGSSTLNAVREYADSHNLIIMSGGSTAPSLAIPHDTTFRLVPDDAYLAKGVGRYMVREGTLIVIPVARNDIWGDDWMNLLKEEIQLRGGTVLDPVRYDGNTPDLTPMLDELSAKVDDAVNQYGAENVAVYTLTYGEISAILHEAATYLGLAKVRWYGSDQAGLSDYDDTSLAFAAAVNFTYPKYGDAAGWRNVPLLEEIEEQIGQKPDPLALNMYDGLWLATYTRLISGSEDPTVYRWLIPEFGENYRGITGRLTIGETGDRTFCFYTFEQMVKDGDTYRWMPILTWINDPEHGELWRPFINGEPVGSMIPVESGEMATQKAATTPAAPLGIAPVLAIGALILLRKKL